MLIYNSSCYLISISVRYVEQPTNVEVMNIGSGNGYPNSALSNFAPHPFVIDGVWCASMEGFLQSLKFESVDMQNYVCTLVGKAAKFKGKKRNGGRIRCYTGGVFL